MKKLILLAAVTMIVLLPAAYLYSEEKAPVKKFIIEPSTIKSQFFCGYCHILTYPKVVKKAHDSWKKDEKHKDVSCSECHYPPEQLSAIIPEHEKIPKDEKLASEKKTELEFMKTELEVLSRLTTILNMDEPVVRTKPRIDDLSCVTSNCHPTTGKGKEGEYWVKKLKFTEYERPDKTKVVVSFTHEAHFDKKKWVEGQELHCATCHRKDTEKKHFEVSKETCNLCHFKSEKAKFAEERAKCSLCHEIPKEPFKKTEKPEEKPITHKDIEERKVSCADCHLQLIKGKGEIKSEKCLDCHENTKDLYKDAKERKVMHKEHVAKQTASCFNCHEPIVHKKEIKDFTYVDASLSNCKVCHSEPHLYPTLLLAGKGGMGVDKDYPIKHHDMKTNCNACHVKDEFDEKGRKVKRAEVKTCVACHTDEEGKLSEKWKADILEELKTAKDIEKQAIVAVEGAKGKVSDKTIKKAMAMLKDAQENLRIVDAGGGVHNKKYSTLLIETAVSSLENVISELKSKK